MINNNFKTPIKLNILALFIGLFIVFYTTWLRILKNRLPTDLHIFSSTLYYYLCVFFVILFLLLFFINLKLVFFHKKHSIILNYLLEFKVITSIININRKYIENAPLQVLEFSLIFINWARYLENFSMFFLKKMLHKDKIYIVILFNFIPKIIVSIFFCIDVFYYFHFYYFYKSLYLLIIPTIMNSYKFIMLNIAERNLFFSTNHLRKRPCDIPDMAFHILAPQTPNIKGAIDLVKHKNDNVLLNWFLYILDTYRNIFSFFTAISERETEIKPFFNLFFYGFYLSGWLYILLASMDYVNIILFLKTTIPLEDPFSLLHFNIYKGEI